MSEPALKAASAKPASRGSGGTPLRGILQRKCACGSTSSDGTCEACKRKDPLQRRAEGNGPAAIPASVNQVLAQPGRPMDPGTRGFMESRFNRDFSGVRIHTDAEAARSAREIHARAYTVGDHIVFGSGHYNPGVRSGQHLLAHELAHTVQQRGLQMRSDGPLDLTQPGQALERQADHAADAVIAGGPLPALGDSPRPVLAREAEAFAPSEPPEPPAPAADAPVLGSGAGVGSSTGTAPPTPPAPPAAPPPPPATGGTGPCTLIGSGASSELRCPVEHFLIPPEKGPLALDMYDQAAHQGALRATLSVAPDGSVLNTFMQGRARTSSLRSSWLRKMHWPAGAQADTRWQALRGPGNTDRFPYVNGAACDMDHVLELQLGGTNAENNVQVLDEAANTSAGSQILNQVTNLANSALASRPPGSPRPRHVTLLFLGARYSTPPTPCSGTGPATTCMAAECLASGAAPDGSAAPDTAGDPVVLKAGPAETTIRALPAPQPTDLTQPRRRTARDLIPGMMLTTLRRNPNGADTVEGRLVQGRLPGHTGDTRIPVDLLPASLGQVFRFNVDPTSRVLALQGAHPEVRFRYPFLSEARMNLRQEPNGTYAATGTLTPSVPLLNRIQLGVAYDATSLSVSLGVPPERLQTPIPHFRFTRAELRAQLLPEFHPEGVLAFEVGPASHPVATGQITVTADANGLMLDGTLDAHLPRVDQARGTVSYRNGEWTGGIRIASTQIGIPGIQSGELNLGFTNAGVTVDGSVTAAIPGGHTVTFGVERTANGGFIYRGDGHFRVPGLHPATAQIRYDGRRFRGTARTGIDLGPLTGDVGVTYEADGETGRSELSGEGTVAVRQGRVNGTFTGRVRNGVLTGDGSVQVQLTENLVGTAGISLNEHRVLRVSGELAIPRPIQVFPRVPREGGHKEFLNRSLDIPILGITLGPLGSVGLIARITAGFGVNYYFGPGTLENVRIAVAFNPLEADMAITADGHADFNIPAYAGAYLRLRGALGLSALIASVTGGIEATAELGLQGGARTAVDLHYAQGLFSVEGTTRIAVSPVFRLGLTANVIAEVGALGLTHEWRRDWQLYNFEAGAGWQMGLEASMGYNSRDGVRLPSLDQIRWIYPQDINPGQILRDIYTRAVG